MDTLDAVQLFSDGRTSMHDLRALLVSMGHEPEAIAQAMVDVLESGGNVRVGAYNRTEYQAELYLNAP